MDVEPPVEPPEDTMPYADLLSLVIELRDRLMVLEAEMHELRSGLGLERGKRRQPAACLPRSREEKRPVQAAMEIGID